MTSSANLIIIREHIIFIPSPDIFKKLKIATCKNKSSTMIVSANLVNKKSINSFPLSERFYHITALMYIT